MISESFCRNALRIALSAVFLSGALRVSATTNTADQIQLGNPSGAIVDTNNHSHYLFQLPVYAMDYSDTNAQPNWVSWDLSSADANNAVGRSPDFFTNIYLPPNFFWLPGDPVNPFTASGYDRGHMCPSADRTDSRTNNDMLFLMSNIIPQKSEQNEGIWANFENQCRTIADAGNEVLITCGPSLFTTNKLYNNRVPIAGYTWKIVIVVRTNNNGSTAASRITPTNRVIVVRIPNTAAVGSDPWQNYLTNAAAVEADTGFTFFTALSSNLATVLRNKIDGQTPPAPGLTGFSPASGPSNSTVVITGTNFVFATNVTFHGISAAFNIDSTTQITATVPAGATSGSVAVATLGGTATSSSNFTVTAATAFADLAVLKSHTGSFTQGDVGDTYTVVVTNVGTAASFGSVTVTDALPAGLTVTAISGSGWATNVANLSATRSDIVVAGAAYPPLTFTVNVSASAPGSITNVASVSGGGETNLANNSAPDPTTILAASIPTVTTGSASNIAPTTATLNGTLNPNGQSTTAQFQYGLTTSYGSNAPVAGNFTGNTAQGASASLTGLTPSTTYHFRLAATNILGGTNGLDQTFTTAALSIVDLAITKFHSGNFTQGDASDTYTILVTNLGTAASSGSITVTDSLPAGLTATALSGSGWTANLGNLTCTRSDTLSAGTNFPPITVTVSVATNASSNVTNIATVSGGGDANFANNSAADPTAIFPLGGGSNFTGVLFGWDVSGQTNYGISSFPPTTNVTYLSVGGLTRIGILTNNNGASHAWGGIAFTNVSAAAAIAANQYITFTSAANAGYRVSYSSISRFDYRHSSTGATNGLLQFQVGSGAFTDIATFTYPTNTSGGASLNPFDLSGFPTLQDVPAATNVTFRLVNWGGTNPNGTWYIFDVAGSAALDFAVSGSVAPVAVVPPNITRIYITNGNTIVDFTGSPSDTAATFTLLGSDAPAGPYTFASSNTMQLTPGLFRVSAPATNDHRFFRIQR
jgi:uncharacterized repeat protein (TIGR01451 family)